MEIRFPVEFWVSGTPVSAQAKRSSSRTAWQERVRSASRAALPDGHWCSDARMAVTLFDFPGAPMGGDLDNIVKPVLDALSRHLYFDDRQVERIWVQRFEPGRVLQFPSPSPVLARALQAVKPLLYIRVSDDPTEGLA